MNYKLKLALAVAGASLLILGSAAVLAFIVWSALAADERAPLAAALVARSGLVVFVALLITAGLGIFVKSLFDAYVVTPHRLAEETRLIATVNPGHRIAADGDGGLQELAREINALADRCRALEAGVESRVAQSRAVLEEERNRFAALMSELAHSVLVCNIEGCILLYNQRALQLLGSHAGAESELDASAACGLGRSLFGVMDRDVVLHALENIQHRIARDEAGPVASFVTALAGGRLIRARMAPVRAIGGDGKNQAPGAASRIAGYVLTLEDIGRRVEWPLETMLARELLAVTRHNIESRFGMRVGIESPDELIWLAVDGYSLVQALSYLAQRLKEEQAVREIRLRLATAGGQITLDLAWDGAPLTADAVIQWRQATLDAGGGSTPLTFDDVVARHNGQASHHSDVAAGTAYFRIVLPLADDLHAPVELTAVPSRPAYYDFDLFHQPGQHPQLDQRLLSELNYTVFDTETTGLEPAAGDEIIAIGAVRIVNGRLLHGETFDQLIDPGRALNPASTRIHGIKPELLAGQPPITRVLPRFHRFCEDTVLVAYNAAFDMRFLQLKEAATGKRFAQPVLDTLMLSAVVHPRQQDHTLEAIAARLGVNIIGRHTALGDAIVTGEIFLRMIPLLAAQGILTLQQARHASRQTPYAKVQY